MLKFFGFNLGPLQVWKMTEPSSLKTNRKKADRNKWTNVPKFLNVSVYDHYHKANFENEEQFANRNEKNYKDSLYIQDHTIFSPSISRWSKELKNFFFFALKNMAQMSQKFLLLEMFAMVISQYRLLPQHFCKTADLNRMHFFQSSCFLAKFQNRFQAKN